MALQINIDELRAKAKAGTVTPAEVSQVVLALKGAEGNERYSLLYIIGRSFATQHEPLVAGYLDCRRDPMLAKLALQILCDFWDKAADYVETLTRFLEGVYWDKNHDVRLQAISSAGHYLRERKSPNPGQRERRILNLLVDAFHNENQRQAIREVAYAALARAYGLEWSEIPSATRHFDLKTDTNPKVLQWAYTAAGKA